MQNLKKISLLLWLAGGMLLAASGCTQKKNVYTAGLQTEGAAQEQSRAAMDPSEETLLVKPETEPERLLVYVCGAVANPGVYELEEGARVYEAVRLAGGFTEGADTQWLNQAEAVTDGQKLRVYTMEETAGMETEPKQPGEAAKESGTSPQVNLNTASAEELMTLPGIGEAKAEAILQYRLEHGAFTETAEIQNIPGIKEAVFSKIKDRITVSG